MTERKALGRGLAALIPPAAAGAVVQDIAADHKTETFTDEKPVQDRTRQIYYIRIDNIKPNRFQPRTDFNDERLKELAESIKQRGLLQPVLVRQVGDEDFELLAGERRWRAVKSLGIDKIPALIKKAHDAEALEIALIENLQRDDLNPIEEARAYKKLIDDFGFDNQRISQTVGKASTTVINMLRLLSLSLKVQEALLAELITTGHAKAILALKDPKAQEDLCDRIIKTGLTVREAERISSSVKIAPVLREALQKDIEITALEEQLQRALGTKVRISPQTRGGRISIEYFSSKDLDRIIEIITRRA